MQNLFETEFVFPLSLYCRLYTCTSQKMNTLTISPSCCERSDLIFIFLRPLLAPLPPSPPSIPFSPSVGGSVGNITITTITTLACPSSLAPPRNQRKGEHHHVNHRKTQINNQGGYVCQLFCRMFANFANEWLDVQLLSIFCSKNT